MKALRNLALAFTLLTASAAQAANGTVLYIPMDDRPVCLDYTVASMEAAGWDVKTPPAEYIASGDRGGNPEALFAWLEENARTSIAIVASSDALIYGGLVDSRTHELPLAVLKQRAERLVNLKSTHGGQLVYVFSTIMRSPKASGAPVEPTYYKEWGPKLFRLGALEDKLELKELRRREVGELADLRASIPMEVLEDMYERRHKNIRTTELLLHGVESGDFDYMLIGRDDTATFSQAHREARSMDILVNELPKERIRFFSGADQLGLLLLSRASSRLQYQLPLVNVTFAAGRGGETVPSYEDDRISWSAKQHIYAAGAFPVRTRKNAELVLAVNTPYDGVTHEASSQLNNGMADKYTVSFAKKVERLVDKGYDVALADIKYGNGADNALVGEIFRKDLTYKLAAYGGWNTAGNSLGFALAQGLLKDMYPQQKREELLEVRYLDDWAYQSNVRSKVYKELIWPNYWPNSGLDAKQRTAAEAAITREIKALAQPVLGATVEEYEFTLPWSRMFEVKVSRNAEAQPEEENKNI